MPKELTHWILADRVLAQLRDSSRIRDIISAHRNIYLAGAVLPDTLLHLHKGPHARTALALAHQFHDSGDNSFAPLIHAERLEAGRLSDPLLACLLGVISHMEADIVFHPFVYAHTGPANIGSHYRLETDIDIWLLHQGFLPPTRLMKDLITPSSRDVLIKGCSLLFDPDHQLSDQAIELALTLHCRIQAIYDCTFWKLAARVLSILFGPPYTQRSQLFYPLFIPQKRVMGLIKDGNWRHPVTGVEQCEYLDELAETAVQRTIERFEQIEFKGSLTDALTNDPGENLLTGIHGACHCSMKSQV
jgi:hypothetical protein